MSLDDDKTVKDGQAPHDRDACANVVAQCKEIDHLNKIDANAMQCTEFLEDEDVSKGKGQGARGNVPQQEGVPQRPSQLQGQPCLPRCTWGHQ